MRDILCIFLVGKLHFEFSCILDERLAQAELRIQTKYLWNWQLWVFRYNEGIYFFSQKWLHIGNESSMVLRLRWMHKLAMSIMHLPWALLKLLFMNDAYTTLLDVYMDNNQKNWKWHTNNGRHVALFLKHHSHTR